MMLALAFTFALIGPLAAQGTAPAAGSAAAPATKPVTLDALKGTWIRPDGGYQIVIKGVGPEGRLDAMYFNPAPLPFAKAEATRGVSLRVHFELRAGGYAGSTYDLAYDRSAIGCAAPTTRPSRSRNSTSTSRASDQAAVRAPLARP
jgi:hypothetical protein